MKNEKTEPDHRAGCATEAGPDWGCNCGAGDDTMTSVLRDLVEQVESAAAQDALKAADLSIDTDNAKAILNTLKGD